MEVIRGIVLHWGANPGSSAEANRNYFESLKNQPPNLKPEEYRFASAHFIIGLHGEIIQCLLENEMGYHVGANKYTDIAVKKLSTYPNNCTIGIELCHPAEYDSEGKKITDPSKWIGKFTDLVLDSAAELVSELCERYNLRPDDIYRHYDITGKDCPRYFVNNLEAWKMFQIKIKVNSLK
jgi:N-acetylmuramoyl-L-alanine amidase